MKHHIAMGFLAVAPLAMGLTGCGEAARPPGVYNVSAAEAYKRLSIHEMPDLVFRRQCGILLHVTPEAVPDGGGKIRWRVLSSGQEVVQFTAILTAISDTQTKVELQIPADPAGGEVYDGDKFYRRPAFNQPLRPAVEEQISAILEGRSFEIERVGPGKDTVCNVQRGGLESGMKFRVDDPPDI